MEAVCAVDILVDLSEPAVSPLTEPISCSSPQDKENTEPFSVSDSIELARSSDNDRRNSLTLQATPDVSQRILRDVTQQSIGRNDIKRPFDSPVVRLLDEEEFDFDLPASPALGISLEKSKEEDDEEVFIGPVGFTERCMAAVVESNNPIEEFHPMSPLNPEQIAELFKEANSVATKLKHAKDNIKTVPQESLPIPFLNLKSSSKEEPSPTKKRHSRGGTFTISKSPYELLSENKRKSLPVVDVPVDDTNTSPQTCIQKEETSLNYIEGEKNTQTDLKAENNKENIKQTRLVFPKTSKLSKLSASRGTTNITEKSADKVGENQLNTRNTSDTSNICSNRKSLPKASTVVTSSISEQKKISRLQPPKSKPLSLNAVSNISQNKSLKTSSANTSMESGTGLQQKSAGKVPLSGTDTMTGSQLKQQKSAQQLLHPCVETTVNKPSIKRSLTLPKSTVSPYMKKPEDLTNGQITRNDSGQKGRRLPQRSSLPGSKGPISSNTSGISLPRTKVPYASSVPSSSGIPPSKTLNASANAPSNKGPATKQQLIKPADFQRKLLATNREKHVNKKIGGGPLKAMVPSAVNSQTVIKRKSTEQSKGLNMTLPDTTPVKPDKRVQPKLLSNNFTTPRSSSTSSIDSAIGTPASSRRRSCLPTPQKSRTSSLSSVCEPSPVCKSFMSGSTRSSSTSSCPDFDDQITRFNGINEKSPSALQPRKPRVVNTPNLPQKKLSAWSPVKKLHPVNVEEEAFMCTKRTAYR